MDLFKIKFKNQSEMFQWIYENREWKSEIDGSPLPNKGHFQWHWCFCHILPKGTYPKWKLEPSNIMLMTPEQHLNQETIGFFIQKKEELTRKYYQEFYGKQF